MTDKLKGAIVTFEQPIKDNFDDTMNRSMIKLELRKKLFEILKD